MSLRFVGRSPLSPRVDSSLPRPCVPELWRGSVLAAVLLLVGATGHAGIVSPVGTIGTAITAQLEEDLPSPVYPPGVGPGSPEDDRIDFVPIPGTDEDESEDPPEFDPFVGTEDEEEVPRKFAAEDVVDRDRDNADDEASEPAEQKAEPKPQPAPAGQKTPPAAQKPAGEKQGGEKRAGEKGDKPAAKETPAADKNSEKNGGKKDEQKGGKPDAKPGEKPAVQNPVENFFQRAFGGPRKPVANGNVQKIPAFAPPRRNGGPEAMPKPNSRFLSDPRVAYDNKKSGWYRQAEAALKGGDSAEALKWVQRILEHPDDSLHRTAKGEWVPMRKAVRLLVAGSPSDFRQTFETQFGGLAARLLAEAERNGDEGLLSRVATLYFGTKAGMTAANRLAILHLERGEVGLAAAWFAELWEGGAEGSRDPKWRMRAAVALQAAGRKELAAKVLGDLATTRELVELGGQRLDSQAWMSKLAESLPQITKRLLSNWPMPFGDASRTGNPTGGTPLLIERWSQPLVESRPAQRQVQYLLEELENQSTMLVPAIQPVMLQDRVIFRTLNGVRVVDARTGRSLWQTENSVPIEPALNAAGLVNSDGNSLGHQFTFQGKVWTNPFLNQLHGGNTENSPLANLLYRNSNFGWVSSDGKRLFLIEDPGLLDPRQPGQIAGFDASNGTTHTGNVLHAYDLQTGQPLWEAGGDHAGDELQLPLAGHFFFGAPLALDGELLVVAERESEIRLCALNPQNGELLWSQLIGAAEVGIGADVARRWWSATVSASQGVLICETTTGWLMGLDRRSHAVLWGYRLTPPSKPGEGGDNSNFVPATPLNGRWSPTPPMIVQGKVICTPSEAQLLFCLDLVTGQELWKRNRAELVYVAGVAGDQIIAVGRNRVTAMRLADGVQTWSTSIEEPSGRGVLSNGRYLLPLASGELCEIDVGTGAIRQRLMAQAGPGSLGNLSLYQGLLLSLTGARMVAYEQESAVRQEIVSRRGRNPNDAWSLLTEAEILVLQQKLPDALTTLRQVDAEQLNSADRTRFRELMFNTLLHAIPARPMTEDSSEDLARLTQLADRPDQLLQVKQLQADRALALGDYPATLEAYLELARRPVIWMELPQDPMRRELRSDVWLAGKLVDFWKKMPESARPEIDRRLNTAVQAAEQLPLLEQLPWLDFLSGSSVGPAFRQSLARRCVADKQFALAERVLTCELSATADRIALEQIRADLYEQAGLRGAAAEVWQQLLRQWPEFELAGGEKLSERAATRLKALGDVVPVQAASWKDRSVQIERVGTNYAQTYTQELSPWLRDEFAHRYLLQVQQQEQRLELLNVQTGQVDWSLPLRSRQGTTEHLLSVSAGRGHQLTLLHRGVLHGVSLLERKLLWSHTLDARGGAGGYYVGMAQNPIQAMSPQLNPIHRLSVLQSSGAAAGMLSLVTPDLILIQERRTLTALDATTGAVRWSCSGVQPGTMVHGGQELIYLQSNNGRVVGVLRAIDGEPLTRPKLTASGIRIAHFVGDKVLTSSSTGKDGKDARFKTLRLYDPQQDRDEWAVEYPTGSLLSLLDPMTVAILEGDGEFQSLDLRTGSLLKLGEVGQDDLKSKYEVFALQDLDQVYLLINSQRSQYYYNEGLPFVRASGKVAAFSIRGGGLKWKQKVIGQNLVLERWNALPVLLFATRKYEATGEARIWMLNLVLLDKDSGEKLLEQSSASQGGFRNLNFDVRRQSIELRSYQERFRLVGHEKTVRAPAETKPAS